ncbi:MAG: hypothetical protein QOG87_2274 [Actinomycetota bacterium]|jgi:putative nucleotidyltransferase with HDIG domain
MATLTTQGWAGHPRLAALVRALITLVPLAAGVGAVVVLAHLIPRPRAIAPALAWWAASFVVSTAVMLAVASQAKRLLPLAALLKLSMVFPDKTPSRFAVALRAGTIGNLKARLATIREEGIESEVGAAAETILVLSSAMNAHDKNTRGHAERVRAFTEMLAAELGLEQDALEKLRWSSLLHDVGKVMVSPEVLNKAGPLDEHEWDAIHRHPDDGARIAAPLNSWLGEWALAIQEHHEKWDGTGYPRGLAGDNISYGARVVAVADAFEVMTAPRSYKAAMSPTAARAELTAGAGSHFDPAVVRAFVGLNVSRLRWVMGPLAWIAQVPVLRSFGSAGASSAAAAGGVAAVATGVALGLIPPAALEPAKATPPAAVAAAPVTTPPAPGAPVTIASVPKAPPTSAARAVAAGTPTTARAAVPAPTTRPNRPPVANNDVGLSAEQGPPSQLAVTANDSDPDGDALTLSVVQQPDGKPNVSSSGGGIKFVPNSAPPGTYSFVYRACDPFGLCDDATAQVRLSG